MLTDVVTDDDGTRNASASTRLRAAQRLRRLADLWPSLDDEERLLLESHLHRLRERASA